MRKVFEILIVFTVVLFLMELGSCSKNNDGNGDPVDTTTDIDSVTNLSGAATNQANQLLVSWINPESTNLDEVIISCRTKSKTGIEILSDTIMDVEKGGKSSVTIRVPQYATYIVTAVAVNKSGVTSEKSEVEARPYLEGGTEPDPAVFFTRADTVMSSMIDLMLTSPRSGVWNNSYPNATGPYWNGDAVVWGQGAGLSSFEAIREASLIYNDYKEKYERMDDLMFDGINKFITDDNNIEAYAVYPASGNQRFYDDNVWIGLDMIDLYNQTKNSRYLDKAEMVWTYLMKGNDNKLGGGIYWSEIPQSETKHTCSTAPAAVLGAKLYKVTNDQAYLDTAISLYHWVKEKLQDKSDYLYWDNIDLEGNVDKSKYSYNSGEPMEAAALLYEITNEKKYLTDAQKIALSSYNKWFTEYVSPTLKERIHYIDGHTWFNAILLRGFLELYKVDGNREYITAYEQTFSNLWLSKYGLDASTKFLSYDHILGDEPQNSWDVLKEAACVEILARLALIEENGQ